MQPSIILDLQKEFLTEAASAPKLFRDLLLFPRSGVGTDPVTLQRHVKQVTFI